LVGGGIIGAGHPDGTAAGLPSVVVPLPGLAARLARRRYGELSPDQLAGRGIESADPVADTLIAVRRSDHDLVLDRERRQRERHVRCIRKCRLPYHFAGVLIRRDDPGGGYCGRRDDEVPPQRGATVAELAVL